MIFLTFTSLFRYQQILQYQMNKNDHDGILRTCQKYGDKDSQLWIRALSFFAKSDKSGECRKQMEEILKCKSLTRI